MTMKTAKRGDRVTVDYWGTLDDGTQFDSSEGKEPLEFTVGGEEMIEGFDKAIPGMKEGETKKVRIDAKHAYGERDYAMTSEVPIERLKGSGVEPKKGMRLSANSQLATIISVTKDKAVLDFNHPLAGKALNFKIKLLKIK